MKRVIISGATGFIVRQALKHFGTKKFEAEVKLILSIPLS